MVFNIIEESNGSGIGNLETNKFYSTLIFYVNGKKVVETEADPEWTLLYYLRNKLGLCGTKLGCGEGGCGACTVVISKINRRNNSKSHLAVNACLTPVCALHGTAVTTVEGLGSVKTKLHAVQERLASAHGSQCGFCTPGFIMSVYALLRTKPLPSMEEIETCLQGNLCRCTGYRPILEGFKTFSKEFQGCCGNVQNGSCCKSEGKIVKATGLVASPDFMPYDPSQDLIFPPELAVDSSLDLQNIQITGKRVTWYRPSSMESLILLKDRMPEAKIVCGNTEVGLEMKHRHMNYPALISPISVYQLHELSVKEDGVVIGGSVTLSEIEEFFDRLIEERGKKQTRTFLAINKMLVWFAGKQIRNVAALSGNIMTGSPISDLNPILMAGRARLLLLSVQGQRWVPMDDKFFTGYRKNIINCNEIIRQIFIPFNSETEYIFAFKQSKRREDDIAIVNSGMRVSLLVTDNQVHIQDASFVFGGMAPTTVFAKKSAQAIIGKEWNESIMDVVLKTLLEDLPLSPSAPGGMTAYRQSLTLSFFFKFYNIVNKELLAIGTENRYDSSTIDGLAHRSIKSAQIYEEVDPEQKAVDMVGRPLIHASALKQVTGEAQYCDDIPCFKNELYLALVTSTRAHARILNIDETEALAMDGVVAFFSAKDLTPSQNITGPVFRDEEIFAREKVECHGQIIGCIVATEQALAQRSARKVKIEYEDLQPILTIEDAIQKDSFYHAVIKTIKNGDVDAGLNYSEHILEGEMRIGGQEHFYLETNAAIAVPKDAKEVDIYCSTQNPTKTQMLVAAALGLPANHVVVHVKRMGGGFGGKETRSSILSIPVAFSAYKLNRPVRCMLDRDEDMMLSGFRHPFLGRYKVGFQSDGTINAFYGDLFSNSGHTMDLSFSVMERALFSIDNAYRLPNMQVTGYCCKTNLPSNTAFRGFGGPQGMMIMESVIDDITRKLKMDPLDIRSRNLYTSQDKTHYNQTLEGCTVKKCIDECISQCQLEERKHSILEFNKSSRWKKRGLSLIPTKYGIAFTATFMNQAGALVMVYTDGSVLLSHGGTEMGQGLHTKMIQIVSRIFEIPVDQIHVIESSTDKVPNTSPTAASASSDLNGMAIVDACQQILQRLKPYRTSNPNGMWRDWVSAAYFDRVSLSASGFYRTPGIGYNFETNQGHPFNYFCYGAACSEVEIDCLTGDHRVIRTDIVMDVGKSINPAIDIGQLEGGFLQGYGLFTMEELSFSPDGVLLTRGPSNYKIPSCNDVPIEFNVTLLKDAPNPKAVYSSKAVGEPPLFLAASVFYAIKDAVGSAREANGVCGVFRFDSPATAERIRMACVDKFIEQIPNQKESFRPWSIVV
ncbi:xanthine dehydrogenase/oxidase-like isoform X2 [Artemia franciscana]|uniref:xanthine dehydrogenase n=2 Tax=Artemia franciscana TaxID=6661 RepID=A0AA88HHB1_ARTSF|nr:hypothetical protein QYM36_015234 [Artemia franciscana]